MRAQALLIDTPVAAWRMRAKNLPGLKNMGIMGSSTQNAPFPQNLSGIGRQNDFQWWYYLDALVGEMRCASLYEDYKAIYNKWFNEDPPSPEKCIAFKD